MPVGVERVLADLSSCSSRTSQPAWPRSWMEISACGLPGAVLWQTWCCIRSVHGTARFPCKHCVTLRRSSAQIAPKRPESYPAVTPAADGNVIRPAYKRRHVVQRHALVRVRGVCVVQSGDAARPHADYRSAARGLSGAPSRSRRPPVVVGVAAAAWGFKRRRRATRTSVWSRSRRFPGGLLVAMNSGPRNFLIYRLVATSPRSSQRARRDVREVGEHPVDARVAEALELGLRRGRGSRPAGTPCRSAASRCAPAGRRRARAPRGRSAARRSRRHRPESPRRFSGPMPSAYVGDVLQPRRRSAARRSCSTS